MPQVNQDAGGVTASLNRDVRLLDNPIWNALNTEQSELALGAGLARRFPGEIGPLSGLVEQTDAAYEALRSLTSPDGVVALFLETPPEMREGWSLIRGGLMSQMIWSGENGTRETALKAEARLRPLTCEDVPAMLELAALTEPGHSADAPASWATSSASSRPDG